MKITIREDEMKQAIMDYFVKGLGVCSEIEDMISPKDFKIHTEKDLGREDFVSDELTDPIWVKLEI